MHGNRNRVLACIQLNSMDTTPIPIKKQNKQRSNVQLYNRSNDEGFPNFIT